MKDFFYMGGPHFMGILTILFVLMFAWAIINIIMYLGNSSLKDIVTKRLVHVRSIGLLALITGILGQLVGLYSAFTAIEQAADISPMLIFGGLKVSMITPMYGLIIYLISVIIWVLADIFILGREKTA